MATFKELGVREDLLRAIELMGYENPMPIQEMVIPHLLNEETDVVGLAQTGTGKTAAAHAAAHRYQFAHHTGSNP